MQIIEHESTLAIARKLDQVKFKKLTLRANDGHRLHVDRRSRKPEASSALVVRSLRMEVIHVLCAPQHQL